MTRDASGLGGGLGRVYQSNFDMYVLPIFSTMIDTAAGVIQATFGKDQTVVTNSDGQTVQSTSATNDGVQLVTQNARKTAQQLISDIRDVRKVMVLPAGSRIDIEINQDIYFPKDKQVVKVADQLYKVPDQEMPTAAGGQARPIQLEPWSQDATGPVVLISGKKYVVKSGDGSGVSSGAASVLKDIVSTTPNPPAAAQKTPSPEQQDQAVKPLWQQSGSDQQTSGSAAAPAAQAAQR